MIVEQAFSNLPEILTGYGFPSQEYEGGIVGAYSLALLQELNGRNVNNPISLMQMEKPFRSRKQPFIAAGNRKRYLRCDLHLNTSPVRSGSRSLSTYGWRHSNWLEAKFFRAFTREGKPKQSSNKVVNTGHLLADLIRLIALVPQERSKQDQLCISGRYLLHVYLNRFEDHITTKWQQDEQHVVRPWVKAITEVGHQTLPSFTIADETDGTRKNLGRPLRDLTIELSTTNYILDPLASVEGKRLFVCCLTRVDAYKISYADHWVSLDVERQYTASSDAAFKAIADFVGSHVSITKESDEQKPVTDDDSVTQGDEVEAADADD